jgi:DNA-binding MarR family transcriptional regulator
VSAKAKAIAFKMLRELSPVELRVLLYILREVSVGEIVAFKELKLKHGVEYDDAAKIFKSLVEKGYVEHIPGRCYNLSKELRSRGVREQILDIMDRLAKALSGLVVHGALG